MNFLHMGDKLRHRVKVGEALEATQHATRIRVHSRGGGARRRRIAHEAGDRRRARADCRHKSAEVIERSFCRGCSSGGRIVCSWGANGGAAARALFSIARAQIDGQIVGA